MIARAPHRRFAAIIWDGGTEHAFSGNTIGELLRDVRSAFPAPAILHHEPLIELARDPIDTATAARALGVTKTIAHARLRRAHRAGWLIKLHRGVYQAAP